MISSSFKGSAGGGDAGFWGFGLGVAFFGGGLAAIGVISLLPSLYLILGISLAREYLCRSASLNLYWRPS